MPDPRALPYRLEIVREYRHTTVPADLNGDGRDEFVTFYTFNAPPRHPSTPRHDAVVLLTHGGEAIDQLNYQGTALAPHFVDVDGDTLPEVLVPVLRGDSLFLSIADARGRKLESFLLAIGAPRVEPEGVLPWDPQIHALYAADILGNGRLELITVLVGGRNSPLPRGVLLHELPGGRLLDSVAVGAFLRPVGLHDYTGDGRLELLASSQATNNGAVAGGFDDRHSYLMMFRLWPKVEVAWSREMGGLGSAVWAAYEDFTGNGRRDILALITSDARGGGARLELIEPGSWRILRQRAFAEDLFRFAILRQTGDANPKIVVSTTAGELIVLDGTLTVLQRRKLDRRHVLLQSVTDLDGDGVGEIVAETSRGLVVLGPDLNILATATNLGFPAFGARVARPGRGLPPYLLGAQHNTVALLRLVPNPFAWFWRWGRWTLLAGAVGILLTTVGGIVTAHRNARLQRAVQTLAVDTAPHGLLLLKRNGRVHWANATLQRWVGGVEIGRWRGAPLEEVLAGAPEALAFCREALAGDPPRHVETQGRFRLGGEPRELRLISEPVLASQGRGAFWLLRFEDRTGEVELREARGWARVAERVAHDFHKPLAGIGQEIDRIRHVYRTSPAADAPVLDAYTQDIKGRIAGLLEKADELRQVLGGGEPRLEEMALNEFVCTALEDLRRDMPPDIDLDLRPSSDAPAVRLDRRLMESVLHNLVHNAVEAMPQGGTITVSTALVRGARVLPAAAPRDYVRLEVTDTGIGIPEELRERIFEPGFTTHRDTGWGLGLAAVRRIVESHRGAVHLDTEQGVGSAFAIYLAAVDRARATSRAQA